MITQTLVTSVAVEISERRAGRVGSGIYAGRSRVLVQRAFLALRTTNAFVFFSGFVEPVFFLLAFGFGLGSFVGTVDTGGSQASYAAYLAPALLASSAMNGALMDATFNVFFKMHDMKLYRTMMATSLGAFDVALGEISWALLRGATYAVGFLAVLWAFGLTTSWWVLLGIPGAVLIAFAAAAVGMALTSFMRSFQQLNWLNFVLLPMFLFSGTFYPLTVYPEWLRMILEALPLAQGIALLRGVMVGDFSMGTVVHITYFVVLIVVGLVATTKRLNALFLR